MKSLSTQRQRRRSRKVSQDFKASKFTYDNCSLALSYRLSYGIVGLRALSNEGDAVASRAYYLLIVCNALLAQHPAHDCEL